MARPSQPFDLDAFERDDAPEPFTFTFGGRPYTMRDPQEMDFKTDLAPIIVSIQSNDVVGAMNGLLEPDDVDAFWENKVTAYKLNGLVERWLEHYGLKPGEAVASSPSSNGTARPSKRTSRSAA